MCVLDKGMGLNPEHSSERDDPRRVPRLLFLPYLVWKNDRIIYYRLPILIPYLIKSFISIITRSIVGLSSDYNNVMPAITPVFILGHWRSGTTYLHKLMASDSRFCFTRLYDVLFPVAPKWMEVWLKPLAQKIFDWRQTRHPHFHDHLFDLNEPSEEDAHLASFGSPFSAYWGYFFPRSMIEYYFLFEPPGKSREKERWKNEHARVLNRMMLRTGKHYFLSKSPPNTCRIPTLLEMYPNAKFIFIQRNPYHIFVSMYRMLEEVTEKYYALQKITREERKQIVISLFRLLMEKYEEGKKLIPEGHLVEIHYEDLLEKPFKQVLHIYGEIKLPTLGSSEKDLLKQIEREKYYKTATHELDRNTLDLINSSWSDLIEKWGYDKI